MMSDFINNISKIKQNIRLVAQSLDNYSNAFYTTGNIVMGNKLESQANELRSINKNLEKDLHKKLDDDLADAQSMAAETFNRYVNPHLPS